MGTQTLTLTHFRTLWTFKTFGPSGPYETSGLCGPARKGNTTTGYYCILSKTSSSRMPQECIKPHTFCISGSGSHGDRQRISHVVRETSVDSQTMCKRSFFARAMCRRALPQGRPQGATADSRLRGSHGLKGGLKASLMQATVTLLTINPEEMFH